MVNIHTGPMIFLHFSCHLYSVLKSMEFAAAGEGEEKSKGKSLEVLLLEKNKALQSENTQLKLSNSDLSGKCRFITIFMIFQ